MCVAPFDSLCVCQAKQCSTALIRLGKWLLHSSTATAVYIRKWFLWRGSDLKWIAESTTKKNCSKSTKTNKCNYDKESRWNDSIDSLEMYTGSRTPHTRVRSNKHLNRQRVLHWGLREHNRLCRVILHANLQEECKDLGDHRCRKLQELSPELLTLDTVRGMLKSLPPCSLKPQGAGPLRVTV